MAKRLTERQKYILSAILEASDGVDMHDLVRRLEVSRRTIQRDMSAIQSYVALFNLVVRMDSKGISVEGDPSDIRRMVEQTGKIPPKLPLAPKVREARVALDLLMEQGPSKLGYFGKQLHVTSASLSQSLDDIARWLNAHGLSLIRRRGYGVEVQGYEEARREAIAELVYEQVSLSDLMALFRQNTPEATDHPFVSWFSKWFDAQQIAQVRDVLMEELAASNPPLDEAAFYGFMLHVLLTISRINSGASLPPPEDAAVDASQDVQTCLRIIRRFVQADGDVSGEAQYLAKHLRGAKVLMTEENRMLPLNLTSMDLAYRMVRYLAKELDMPLAGDRGLIVGMAQHLEPAIHRMMTGLHIRNPLLEEIKRRYETLFHAMRSASDSVLGPYGLEVPDAEVGYLTMHLGASYERLRAQRVFRVRIVCPNGISSAELLASRFRKEFPQVKIVGLGSLHDPADVQCDLVVSTVPLDQQGVPVVTVSPFLTDEEVAQIESVLEGLEADSSPLKSGGVLEPALPESKAPLYEAASQMSQRVQIRRVSAKSIREVIEKIVDDIWSTGDTNDKTALMDAILQREQLGSIVLPGKRLSVLHARTHALSQYQVAIYRLEEPFTVLGVAKREEPVDTVVVLLALSSESVTNIRLFGTLSSALVMDDDLVDILRNAPISVVRQRIRQVMYQTEE
ncbi:BglG family transcription antiterminator [Alicyclobacillus acidoterrestris]|uniref:BglG family transcription antiterminator n=1 Tax=Alicyclobacillus acidoterrestris TaxID=1450 RepID=UPI003F53CDE0